MKKKNNVTNEVRYNAAIADSTSGVVEEGFTIWPEVCFGGIDVDIVSCVKERVSKYEQCSMVFWQLSKARVWNNEKGGTEKGQYTKVYAYTCHVKCWFMTLWFEQV